MGRMRLVTNLEGSKKLVRLYHKSVLRSVEDEDHELITDGGDYVILRKVLPNSRQPKQIAPAEPEEVIVNQRSQSYPRPRDNLLRAALFREGHPAGNRGFHNPSLRPPVVPDPRTPFEPVRNLYPVPEERKEERAEHEWVHDPNANIEPEPEWARNPPRRRITWQRLLRDLVDLVKKAWVGVVDVGIVVVVVFFMFWVFDTFHLED